MLKKNGQQESIINKIFNRIPDSYSLPQSQQQRQATDIQEEEIRTNINLPYFQGANEKMRRTLKPHKIRSTFYTKTTLHNLLCKAKYPVATEDQNNIVCEIDGSILLW